MAAQTVIPTIKVDFTDSIPLLPFWTDDVTGTPVRITLKGTVGSPLDDPDVQLCYFSLIDQDTDEPVTVGSTLYQYIPLNLDLNNTQANYMIQDFIPVGRYTMVAEYDSTQTTDPSITPLRKKAFGYVIVERNPRGDIDPEEPMASQIFTRKAITSAYTILKDDPTIIALTAASDFDITLPLASTVPAGKLWIIVDEVNSNNAHNILFTGSDKAKGINYNNSTSLPMNANASTWWLECNGVDSYNIIARATP